MDILAFSLNATMPVVLCMALGLFSRRVGLIDKEIAPRLGNYCFSVFIPALIFYSIYSIDFSAEFSLRLVLFTGISITCLIIVLCLIFFSTLKDKAKAAAYVHLSHRSNYAMYGVALTQGMFGSAGLRVAAMLIPVAIILFNLAAVLLLSYGSANKDSSPGQMAREFLLNLLKNPLIITIVVALTISLSPLVMPAFLYATVQNISGVAVPLSLIVVGSQIKLSGLKKDVKDVAVISCMRLIVVPLIMLPIAVHMGFRGPALAALFAIFASPCANAGAIMSQKYNIYPDLANQTLATTTVFSGLTNFVGISILRYLQFF